MLCIKKPPAYSDPEENKTYQKKTLCFPCLNQTDPFTYNVQGYYPDYLRVEAIVVLTNNPASLDYSKVEVAADARRRV